MLTYTQSAPPSELQYLVEYCWSLENSRAESVRQLVFADGGMDLLTKAAPLISGVASTAHWETIQAGAKISGSRLKPGALYSLARVSAKELRDAAVPLADLKLAPPAPIDPHFAGAIATIDAAHGTLRIEELGTRRLRRLFDKYVGLSPKQYARIVRLSHLVDLSHGIVSPNWAELAGDAGYYDQSHLIGDFQELAGTTPDRYHASVSPVRFFQYA